MKIRLEDDYRKYYTLEDLDAAREVIKMEREDESSAAEWATYAINEALHGSTDSIREILKAEARTARNIRAWNAYGEGTKDMDVWIQATARTDYGFIEIGAYLSDIWMTGAEHYKDRMTYQLYRLV